MYLCYPLQQVGEGYNIPMPSPLNLQLGVCRRRPFIGVYVLSEQRDFPISIFEKASRFRHNRFGITTTLAAAGKRHDTKCAHVIAPSHNRDERCDTVRVQTYRTDVGIRLFPRKKRVDTTRPLVGLTDQSRQVA